MTAPAPLALSRSDWLSRRLAAFRVIAPLAFLVIVPAAAVAVKLAAAIRADAFAVDFVRAYWPAGRAFAHGVSPYAPITTESHALNAVFAYPPPAAALFAPFAWLPPMSAAVLFTFFVTGALVATLRVLDVSDWRCYGAAFLWPPVAYAIQTANITLLLTLGLALAWRFRSRPLVVGGAVGALLALKLFLWPLLIWLLAARRYRGAADAVAVAAGTTLAAWAVIGFADGGLYLNVLSELKELGELDAYTPFALVASAGVDDSIARALGYGLAGLAAVATFVVGRRSKDESTAFLLAVATALLANPLTWIHSFALLLVPVAILRPRFHWFWAVPIVLVVVPARSPGVFLGVLTLALFGAVAVFAASARRRVAAVTP